MKGNSPFCVKMIGASRYNEGVRCTEEKTKNSFYCNEHHWEIRLKTTIRRGSLGMLGRDWHA